MSDSNSGHAEGEREGEDREVGPPPTATAPHRITPHSTAPHHTVHDSLRKEQRRACQSHDQRIRVAPRADQSCGGERTLRRGTPRGHCSRAERGAGRARRVIYWGTPSCHTCHAMRMRMFTGNAMPCRATPCHAVLYHAMRMRMRHATLFYTTPCECGCAMFSGFFVLRNSRTSVL